MALVGLSLGSNLGERESLLSRAVAAIVSGPARSLVSASSLYETEPVDCPPGSPPFLNAVIEVETDLTPEALLEATQAIEFELGRKAKEERPINAPRPVDIDLLYFDSEVREGPDLILPHPRMYDRAFVLAPLAEIQPSRFPLPDTFSHDGIRKLDSLWIHIP